MRLLATLVLVIFVGLVVGIPWLLSPDDIKECDTVPRQYGNRCQAADAIVAVSGGDTAARTDYAVDLYQRGWAPKLIFSGDALDPESPSNASVMRQQAIDRGVPSTVIEIEEGSRDTAENATNVSNLLIDEQRILLVTSAYHQRRAELLFQQSNPLVTIVNAPIESDSQWSGRFWWTRASGWWLATSEIAKIIVSYGGIR